MAKEFAPRRLDVRRFAEQGAVVQGAVPVGEMTRLAAESQPAAATRSVEWHARGEVRNAGHVHPEIWIQLEASTTLALVCQRCLQPMDVPVAVNRAFRFVADEGMAAAEDDAAEEEVLALSREFDLLDLVEDEILMDMPVAPRHEACPEAVKMSVADPAFHLADAERRQPFAILDQLKTGKH